MTRAPTQAELEAARQVLRSHGGHRRASLLSKKRLSEIAKKANKASHLAKKKKKLQNNS